MKHNFTIACCLLLTTVFLPRLASAQFFNYLPGTSDYIRGDVKSDPSGLTFSYLIQDPELGLKTILLHTDNNGEVEWTVNTSGNFGSYTLAPDLSVYLTGGRSTAQGNRVALFQKMDIAGNILWTKSLSASSADVGIGNVMVGPNNIIYATINRSSFLSNSYYTKAGVMAFDTDGNVLWTKYFADAGPTSDYRFSRTLLAANGDFIGVADIRGSQFASANGMMVTRINPEGTIVFSKYIDFLPTHNQLSVTGLVETSSQDIIFGGRLMTDQISSYPNTMWLAKMNSEGIMAVQKVYSGGEDVGEQLRGMAYANGNTVAYLQYYSPFMDVPMSIWIGTIDEQTLTITARNATNLHVNGEDPYGNVQNSIAITSDGKPTMTGGFYCVETSEYLPVMQQWTSDFVSSCAALDVSQSLTDSVTTYVVTDYLPQGTFTITHASDDTVIELTLAPPLLVADLCDGCAVASGIDQIEENEGFTVYPNPGNGIYFIDMKENFRESQLEIYNSVGTTVYQTQLQGIRQSIDLSAQAPGIYFVKLRTADGREAVSKLIKIK